MEPTIILKSMAGAMSAPIVMEVSLDSIPLIPHYVESEPFQHRSTGKPFARKQKCVGRYFQGDILWLLAQVEAVSEGETCYKIWWLSKQWIFY